MGRVGRGFLSISQILEEIAGRPLPTIEKDGITVSLVYTRSRRFLLIPGHQGLLVYTRCSALFTPVAGVWWALFGPV